MTAGDLSQPYPAPPAAAAATFADRLPLAVRYAELLCGPGVQRGLLGPREPERIWSRHLLNSAALAELVPPGSRVVDLGSGAGLPGIPLWLAAPGIELRLVEPMERRATFLREVVAALDLPISVERARAEDVAAGSADVVVARAVAPLARLVELALPILRPGGTLLALKGRSAQAEIEAARGVLHRWRCTDAHLRRVGADSITVVSVTRPVAGTTVPPAPATSGSKAKRR